MRKNGFDPKNPDDEVTISVKGTEYTAKVEERETQLIIFYEKELEDEFEGAQGIKNALGNILTKFNRDNSDKQIIYRAE